MTGPQRILLVVATVAVLAIAFFVFAPGDDDEPDTAATTTATQPQTTTTQPSAPPPAPKPQFTTVRVRDGKPVGGVRRITVKKNDRARIEVRSPDTSDEIHLHGYDLYKDLRAGGRARFSFDANAEGIYEIELHSAGVQIAELRVEPR